MGSELIDVGPFCLQKLKSQNVDSAQIRSSQTRCDEISYDSGRFTLLRTSEDCAADIRVIMNGKAGRFDINKVEKKELENACTMAVEMANSATADLAHGFSEESVSQEFQSGPPLVDRELMYQKVNEFALRSTEMYPHVGIRNITARFYRQSSTLTNSNDVRLQAEKSFYQFQVTCCGMREEKSGSMNYATHEFTEVPDSLFEMDTFQRLLGQTGQHTDAGKSFEKFNGTLVISPKCLSSFLGMLMEHLGTGRIVSQTSRFLDKIDQKVLSDKISIGSDPQSFANPVFFTDDGNVAKKISIFDRGVLKSYLLDLYGAQKTGLGVVSNFGQRLIVQPGTESLESIVSGIKNGLLIDRFSGGQPSVNGDFSGIAKNSFLIQDGKIGDPVQETMISGNLFDMFNDIESVSQEHCNDGRSDFPWVATRNISVS